MNGGRGAGRHLELGNGAIGDELPPVVGVTVVTVARSVHSVVVVNLRGGKGWERHIELDKHIVEVRTR